MAGRRTRKKDRMKERKRKRKSHSFSHWVRCDEAERSDSGAAAASVPLSLGAVGANRVAQGVVCAVVVALLEVRDATGALPGAICRKTGKKKKR